MAAISDKLGWHPHIIRAALTGLRKADFGVVGGKPGDGKPTRYWVVTRPADAGKTDVPEATDASKPDLDRSLAIAAGEEAFGSPPPSFLSVAFMCTAVAYEEQCRISGRLQAAARRSLRQIAEDKPIAVASRDDLRACAEVDWPDLPGRGQRRRVSHGRQGLTVALSSRKAHCTPIYCLCAPFPPLRFHHTFNQT